MYPYTSDLMCLDFCHPVHAHRWDMLQDPVACPGMESSSPFPPGQGHCPPLVEGIQEGFRIGLDWTRPRRSAPHNMPSAREHPEVVGSYLQKECSLGHMLGPFTREEVARLPVCHVNRFGVISKGHNTS